MKRLVILIVCTAVTCSLSVGALLSGWTTNNDKLTEGLPAIENNERRMLSLQGRTTVISGALTEFKEIMELDEDVFEYVYDFTIADSLNLAAYEEVDAGEMATANYTYTENSNEVINTLNSTLASIYARYIEKANLPLKDPLWFIAIGSVEYNYTTNDAGLIFSFPVDVGTAANDSNYLLKYDWKEVQRIGGNSAVLRRDGSSIGIFQITSGYGVANAPIIPEEFGIIGSVDGRRTDCWLELGDGTDSGAAIVWKPGVNGDRWSPADNANIICGVYDAYFKSNTLAPEIDTNYEKAILLMWSHNRGLGILNKSTYIERTEKLATKTTELLEFVRQIKPVRFTRADVLMEKVRSIADECTDGDLYPVMALASYLITECRYRGEW